LQFLGQRFDNIFTPTKLSLAVYDGFTNLPIKLYLLFIDHLQGTVLSRFDMRLISSTKILKSVFSGSSMRYKSKKVAIFLNKSNDKYTLKFLSLIKAKHVIYLMKAAKSRKLIIKITKNNLCFKQLCSKSVYFVKYNTVTNAVLCSFYSKPNYFKTNKL
jgi:hypothetical protein